MGNFGSLGSGILNANTKCSLRGRTFSPMCFNWRDIIWEGHIALVPLFSPLNPYSRLGYKQFFRRYWVKELAISECYNGRRSNKQKMTSRFQSGYAYIFNNKKFIFNLLVLIGLFHIFILTRHKNNKRKVPQKNKNKNMYMKI